MQHKLNKISQIHASDASLLIERAAAAMLHAQHRGGNQFSLLR
jgi:GGDEF domain-containing protein